MARPTVKKMVEKQLRAEGYEGLSGEYCCCEVDDLMPCNDEDFSYDCEAGYKIPCPGPDVCEADGDCPWHIGPKKE